MQKKSFNNFTNQIICLAAALTVCFVGIFGHDLWTPDEPRVAAISLEMANLGDFVIPRLAGEPFVEKPPLYFACAAAMVKFFGPAMGNTGIIRFTTVLFGLGVLFMTFLISRIIGDARTGVLSVVILATMEGFVENFHWIRVDAALAFFVAASVWCFVEVYFKDRIRLLPLAGIFASGAFLSKGLIGPLLIGVPWAGLVVSWFFSREDKKNFAKGMIAYHIAALLIFFIVSGLWVFLLYFKGGKDLFHQWFWINHVGRVTGTGVTKGHIRSGKPFYYVVQLFCYAMPWIFMVLYWFGKVTTDFVKKIKNFHRISKEDFFLYVWGLGSLVFLSFPATKRGIYLAPVLPAYAIMAAMGLKSLISRWLKLYMEFWIVLSLVLMAVITLIPLAGMLIPDSIPIEIKTFITHFNHYNFISGILLLSGIGMSFGKLCNYFTLETRMVFVTAGLFITLLGNPVKAIDLEKSMGPGIQTFVSKIPESKQSRIAGKDFSETMLGSFYYYANWRVPQIRDGATINQIISGHHPLYDSFILNKRNRGNRGQVHMESCDFPWKVSLETMVGVNRGLYWIEGLGDKKF